MWPHPGSLGRARADEGVDLVDEDDPIPTAAQLGQNPLEALLELAAILGAGDDRREIQGDEAFVSERRRHPSLDHALGQSLHDRGLPNPGFAHQDGIVLEAPGEDFDDLQKLPSAADQRVEATVFGGRRQIPAVFGDERQSPGLGQLVALLNQGRDLPANPVGLETVSAQEPGCLAASMAQGAENQADAVEVRPRMTLGLRGSEVEDPLTIRREWQVRSGGDRPGRRHRPRHLPPQLFGGELIAPQELIGRLVSLPRDGEQEMVRIDHPQPQLAGLVTGEIHGPADALIEMAEHTSSSFSLPREPQWAGRNFPLPNVDRQGIYHIARPEPGLSSPVLRSL